MYSYVRMYTMWAQYSQELCLLAVCGDCVSTNMDTCDVSVVLQDIFMLFRVNMLLD